MKIQCKAIAGSLESSDALVCIAPLDSGIEIKVTSVVMKQWGAAIQAFAETFLKENGVSAARLEINDRGALECTLRARLETVLQRACTDQAKN